MTLFCTYDNLNNPVYLSNDIIDKYDKSLLYILKSTSMLTDKHNNAIVLDIIEYDIFLIICKLLIHNFQFEYVADDLLTYLKFYETHRWRNISNKINRLYKAMNFLNLIDDDKLYLKLSSKYAFECITNNHNDLLYIRIDNEYHKFADEYKKHIIKTVDIYASLSKDINNIYILLSNDMKMESIVQ